MNDEMIDDYGTIAGTTVRVRPGNRFSAIVGSGWDKDGLPNLVHISGMVDETKASTHIAGTFWATLDSDSRERVGLSRCVVFVHDVVSCWASVKEGSVR